MLKSLDSIKPPLKNQAHPKLGWRRQGFAKVGLQEKSSYLIQSNIWIQREDKAQLLAQWT